MDLDGTNSTYYDKDSTLAVYDTLAKFIEISKVTVDEYNVRQVKYPIMYLGSMFRGKWSSDISQACCQDVAVLLAVCGFNYSGWKRKYARVKQVIKGMAMSAIKST